MTIDALMFYAIDKKLSWWLRIGYAGNNFDPIWS